jgi:AcrR family transcriptional regulator
MQARHDARRAEIVDIAASLFATKGYDATGVDALCVEVGMAKGNLYHYIGSKTNLLALIHERVMDEFNAETDEIAALAVPATERLRRLGEAQIRIITEFPDHVRVFLREFRALDSENAVRVRESRRSFERLVEQVLRDGVEAGEFVVADFELAMLGWLGMHNYSYLWHQASERDAQSIAAHFFELFLRGVVPRAGVA